MSNNLYFLKDGKAEEMHEQEYEQEKVLQKIIADNPNILLRDSEKDGAHLFLVAQEFDIAEGGDSTNSYAIDHLMLDQSGTPVLVEVKRATDTRSRREVVAQMLDYASRASSFDINKIRDGFLKYNSDTIIAENYDTECFWNNVANCLKAENLRLIFAADQIHDTLKTLIEFLNRNLADIDVYGVEIQQYKANDTIMLTSNIVGGGSVESRKAAMRSIEWDADTFSAHLMSLGRKDAIDISKEICDYARSNELSIYPGKGRTNPSFIVKLGKTRLFSVSSWVKRNRHICTFEFCIRDLLMCLPNSWDEQSLRNTLTNLSLEQDDPNGELLWNTNDNLYIELCILSSAKNMDAMKSAIKIICDAILEKQNEGSIT